MSKKTIIIIIIGVIVIIGIFALIAKNHRPVFEIVKAEKGAVISEIFETGVIKKGDEINLGFELSGKIDSFYAVEGESVKKGKSLAGLEDASLKMQLDRALAGLNAAEANYNKLVFGAAQEDINLVEIAVKNAKSELSAAAHNLEKVIFSSEEALKKNYGEAFSTLNDCYIKASSVYDTTSEIWRKYLSGFSSADSINAGIMRDKIQGSSNKIKTARDLVQASDSFQEIDENLLIAKENIRLVFNYVDAFLEIFKKWPYKGWISDSDFSDLVSEKTSVNQSILLVDSLIDLISLTRSTNKIETNSAQAKFDSAQGSVDKALLELEKIKSPARQEDISQAKAQVEQAGADVKILEKSIKDSVIKAPIDGTVLRIHMRTGEIVQPGSVVISFLPEEVYQAEVNVYEGNIGKIKIGNKAEIEAVAFPDKVFNGEVIFIDSGSKIIDGIVYYRVLLNIEDAVEEFLPGMTVDITIITDKKENALIVPEQALVSREAPFAVYIMENNEIQKKEIEIGLIGTNRMVEVLSGINEGDSIVIK